MKMSAEKPAAKHSGRKVRHISVHRMSNAYEVAHSREQPESKGARIMMGPQDPDPKPSAFAKKKQALSHVSDLMDQMGEPENEAAEGQGDAPVPAQG